MKRPFPGLTAATLAACIASVVGCYPAYPPPPANFNAAYNQDSKSNFAPQQPVPQQPIPQGPPPRYVVDPGLVVAGAVAAGLLGYAIGNNHGYHHGSYYGPGCYRPAYHGRGYYAPPYYR